MGKQEKHKQKLRDIGNSMMVTERREVKGSKEQMRSNIW